MLQNPQQVSSPQRPSSVPSQEVTHNCRQMRCKLFPRGGDPLRFIPTLATSGNGRAEMRHVGPCGIWLVRRLADSSLLPFFAFSPGIRLRDRVHRSGARTIPPARYSGVERTLRCRAMRRERSNNISVLGPLNCIVLSNIVTERREKQIFFPGPWGGGDLLRRRTGALSDSGC